MASNSVTCVCLVGCNSASQVMPHQSSTDMLAAIGEWKMNKDQERAFIQLVAVGRIPVDVMDGLRKLIEEIAISAWERGKIAGASPHDGTWPETA